MQCCAGKSNDGSRVISLLKFRFGVSCIDILCRHHAPNMLNFAKSGKELCLLGILFDVARGLLACYFSFHVSSGQRVHREHECCVKTCLCVAQPVCENKHGIICRLQ